MRRKNHEHLIEIRCYVRAANQEAAARFAQQLNNLIEQEVTGNFLKYRVSLTGNSVRTVEDIDA